MRSSLALIAIFLAIVSACQTNSECEKDLFCSKASPINDQNSCNAVGQCEPKTQACTFILLPVCGCDDKTYANECVAHSNGVNVASEGECGSTETKTCLAHQDCRDNEFCEKPSCNHWGICTAIPTDLVCIALYDPVCDCQGETHSNGCVAQRNGRIVSTTGACAAVGFTKNENNVCMGKPVAVKVGSSSDDKTGIDKCKAVCGANPECAAFTTLLGACYFHASAKMILIPEPLSKVVDANCYVRAEIQEDTLVASASGDHPDDFPPPVDIDGIVDLCCGAPPVDLCFELEPCSMVYGGETAAAPALGANRLVAGLIALVVALLL